MKKLILSIFGFISMNLSAQVSNNECSNAIFLNGNSTLNYYSTFGATFSSEPDACTTPIGNSDVWFTFTAVNSQRLIDTQGGGISWSLYTGTCGNLTQVCDSQNQDPLIGNIIKGLIIGQTYYLRVYLTSSLSTAPSHGIAITYNPNHLEVDNSSFTVEQLVNDVLFNDTCASVSNITSSTGTNFGSPGIAYFERHANLFRLDEGVILSTGNTTDIGANSMTSNLNAGNIMWAGDSDLQSVLAAAGNTAQTYNATSIEFDFTAPANRINFEYVFASEEYGPEQCISGDAFAILLTDLETGTTTNIALVPDTDDIVSAATIRNNYYAPACSNENADYFDIYLLNETPAVTFDGYTMPLTATGTIIPNHPYHIKIVIADSNNTNLDSGVFISSAKFTIDAPEDEIGEKIATTNFGYICSSSTNVLSIDIEPAFELQWSLNGVAIEGATSPSYTATQGGTYSVYVSYPGAAEECSANFETTVTYIDLNPEIEDVSIQDTDSDGFVIVNFTEITQSILTQNQWGIFDYELLFYLTAEDAAEGINADALQYMSPGFVNTSNPQTLYVRTQSVIADCFSITPFTLTVFTAPTAPTGVAQQYFIPGETLNNLVVEGENIIWYATETDNTPLPVTMLLQTNTTYYCTQTINDIQSTDRLAVTAIQTSPPPSGNIAPSLEPGATLADLEVEGENIQWYDNPGSAAGRNTNDNDDIPLPLTTLLVDSTTYYASQTIDGIESIERLPVTVHIVTMGFEENIFSALQVFPNPVKNMLSIINNEDINNVMIYNLLGQVIIAKEINSVTTDIDLSSINKGIYILQITSKASEKIIKIVKE